VVTVGGDGTEVLAAISGVPVGGKLIWVDVDVDVDVTVIVAVDVVVEVAVEVDEGVKGGAVLSGRGWSGGKGAGGAVGG
jgi:hypothetical protein